MQMPAAITTGHASACPCDQVGFLTSYLIMNHSGSGHGLLFPVLCHDADFDEKTKHAGINDPAKSSFIQDPVVRSLQVLRSASSACMHVRFILQSATEMVSAVAFFLCGSIACYIPVEAVTLNLIPASRHVRTCRYDFCALYDHLARGLVPGAGCRTSLHDPGTVGGLMLMTDISCRLTPFSTALHTTAKPTRRRFTSWERGSLCYSTLFRFPSFQVCAGRDPGDDRQLVLHRLDFGPSVQHLPQI